MNVGRVGWGAAAAAAAVALIAECAMGQSCPTRPVRVLDLTITPRADVSTSHLGYVNIKARAGLLLTDGSRSFRLIGTSPSSLSASLTNGPFGARKVSYVRGELDGAALFGVHNSSVLMYIYRSDGTSAGTWLLGFTSDFVGASRGLGPGAPVVVAGGRVYVAGFDTVNVREGLWSSDGRPMSLAPVENAASVAPRGLTAFGTKVFFGGADSATGLEPWVSDGTAAGTYRLRDIRPGPWESIPGDDTTDYVTPAVFDKRVYFGASDGVMACPHFLYQSL